VTIERMFVAVTPPPEIVDIVSDLPTRALRGVRYTKRSQWHITLRYLGDCERHEALKALDQLSGAAVTVELGPAVTLLGSRVVIVPARGLDEIAQTVDALFDSVGETTDREFVGHLTLARLKGRPLRDPSLVSVIGEPVSASFACDSLDLWKTELGESGTTHTLVATQTLT